MLLRLLNRMSICLIAAALLAGCGPSGGSSVATNSDLQTPSVSSDVDTSDEMFVSNRVLDIDIQMDAGDYDVMRIEGRSLPKVFSGCWKEYPDYTHFKATVTVDDKVLRDVDIRKKGFLGSISASRPSVKLNFGTHVPGRRLKSLERMTLNNNRQDPSNTHQCITYQLFRDAGLSAPRCNFARVSINGRNLGIYTHVESVKKHFLRRSFGEANDEGNLYEAQVADFGELLKENFQLKTNELMNDRSDLDLVVSALQADDLNLPNLLSDIVDLDAFIDFWAMETITGHWDGAAGNANNYFVYHDPFSGKFHYIPWGTDGAMELGHPFRPNGVPLYRYGRIHSRLYSIPEYRDQYHTRLLELLDEIWDADTLNAEVDRIQLLTDTPEEELASSRQFIDALEERIRSAVAGNIPQTESTIVDEATVCDDSNITSVSGSFIDGNGSFEYVDLAGNLVVVPAWAEAPRQEDGDIVMNLIGEDTGAYRVIGLIDIEESDFGSEEVWFQGVATMMQIGEWDGENWNRIGYVGDGSIVFDEPAVLGEPTTMSFSAELWLRIPGQRF